MRRISKLILQAFAGPFLVAFVLTLFILLMQFVWRYIDDFMGKGLDGLVIAELIFYATLNLLPMSLPLTVLFAAILTLGNLGERNELTALKAAGLSLFRIFRPLFFAVCVVTGFAFVFSMYILPKVSLKFHRVLYDVATTKPAFDMPEKVFYRGIEGLVIRIGKKDKKDMSNIYDVMIYDHSEPAYLTGKDRRITVAKTGKMEVVDYKNSKKMRIELFDGHVYENSYPDKKRDDKHPHKQYAFKRMSKLMDMPGFTMKKSDDEDFQGHYEMMIFSELTQVKDSFKNIYVQSKEELGIYEKSQNTFLQFPAELVELGIADSLRYECLEEKEQERILRSLENTLSGYVQYVQNYLLPKQERAEKNQTTALLEWHFRITFPLSCILMFLIGAPLGSIVKKGGLGLPVLFSVIFFILYFVISTISKSMAEDLLIPAFLGQWSAIVLLLPIALYLNNQARKEAGFFDFSIFKRLFKK
jgi:lipopolysaccharide export system permease protein